MDNHAATSTRPPHPASTSVTTAKRPSYRDGTGLCIHNFRKNEIEIFFAKGLDRGDLLELAREMSFLAQVILAAIDRWSAGKGRRIAHLRKRFCAKRFARRVARADSYGGQVGNLIRPMV
jgi:hypothetical protein